MPIQPKLLPTQAVSDRQYPAIWRVLLRRNVYHWTKVVLIERQMQSVVPDVTIEKRKCLAPAPTVDGDSSKNSNDFDVENHESEYLFLHPDPEWEFDREHLHLKSDLGQVRERRERIT